jgi:hypothetical protein
MAAVNTILSGRMVRELPRWYIVAVAAFLCMLSPLVFLRLSPGASAASGIVMSVVVVAVSAFLLAMERVWADPTAVAGGLLVSSLGIAAMKVRWQRAPEGDS